MRSRKAHDMGAKNSVINLDKPLKSLNRVFFHTRARPHAREGARAGASCAELLDP